jgi:high-affinity Fe2+/Pb2+ permease
MGIVLAIYGIIVLIGAAMACPCKDASISVSLFMLLTGIAFFFLGKDIEKAKEAK